MVTKTLKKLSLEQEKHLSEADIMSSFNFCPVICTLCGQAAPVFLLARTTYTICG